MKEDCIEVSLVKIGPVEGYFVERFIMKCVERFCES